MYQLKIHKGVTCHDNGKRWKCGRGIDLSFQNLHEDFDEFWPEHLKISNICILMGCLWPKYIMLELKKYRELCLMALNIDAKFEGKLAFAFKNDMRKLVNFHQSTWGLKIWWDSFIQSRKCMSLKVTRELLVMATEKDEKLEEELTCHFKINMTTLMNFDPSTLKSQTFAL